MYCVLFHRFLSFCIQIAFGNNNFVISEIEELIGHPVQNVDEHGSDSGEDVSDDDDDSEEQGDDDDDDDSMIPVDNVAAIRIGDEHDDQPDDQPNVNRVKCYKCEESFVQEVNYLDHLARFHGVTIARE